MLRLQIIICTVGSTCRLVGKSEMIYYARLHSRKDGFWTEFPEFGVPGSEGFTIAEVADNSREALEGILESLFDRECKIPLPAARRGKNWLPIAVDDSI